MKKTEYFLSNFRSHNQTLESLNEVVGKRDEFIKKNTEKIGEIYSEKVNIVPSNSANIYVILTLTYFLK